MKLLVDRNKLKANSDFDLQSRSDLSKNRTVVTKADWDCLENCYGCIFKITDVNVESCHDYKDGIQVRTLRYRIRIFFEILVFDKSLEIFRHFSF